jgi:hypothetical protein
MEFDHKDNQENNNQEPKKEKVVKSNKVNELLLADKRYQKIIADIKILDNKKDKLDNKKNKIIAKILSENIK